jgi:hypothetical protein
MENVISWLYCQSYFFELCKVDDFVKTLFQNKYYLRTTLGTRKSFKKEEKNKC